MHCHLNASGGASYLEGVEEDIMAERGGVGVAFQGDREGNAADVSGRASASHLEILGSIAESLKESKKDSSSRSNPPGRTPALYIPDVQNNEISKPPFGARVHLPRQIPVNRGR